MMVNRKFHSKNVNRNSAIEMLRLLSIVGIICMHMYGKVTLDSVDLLEYAFVNTLFNCGVSLFVLISGFYSIRPSFSGGARLVLITVFYSVISYIVETQNGGSFELKELVRSFLPISAGRYWFISAYFVLFCFADLINKALEKMSQEEHFKLILRFLILFVVLPTLTFLHIMGDGGKGLCNM